jgi:hypothetical protein
MDNSIDPAYRSASDLLRSLFESDLADQTKFDPATVELVRKHLLQQPIHSKAGARLADELTALAKSRATESQL